MKWFKFYGQDYISDPKILSLSPAERSCWITLLSYASINEKGTIFFLSEEQLMTQAGLDFSREEWEKTRGVLKKLENLQMIRIDNACNGNDNVMITVLNWQKRQETSLTSYERVKRYREKKRNDNGDDNAKITLDEIRRDINTGDAGASLASKNTHKKMKKNTLGSYREDRASDSHETVIDADTGETLKTQPKGSHVMGKKNLLNWAELRRGKIFTFPAKQFKAMEIMILAKKTPKEIQDRWEEFENNNFYKEKGFDFMDIALSFDKR